MIPKEATAPALILIGLNMFSGLRKVDLANFTDMDSIADKWEMGTKAFCELYDGVFGDGTSKKLFGDEPYYGLCLEVYYEILGAIQQQGAAYGHKVSKTLTQFAPAGP